MKIQYISDIHLELLFSNSIKMIHHLIQPRAEILVLAGDIGNPYNKTYKSFLEKMSAQFRKIFIIAGNHEYYTNDVNETKNQIKLVCGEYTNVTFLDNAHEDYAGYRFIGTTLWTHIKKPQFTINDTKMIKKFTPQTCNELHTEAARFLEDSLQACRRENIKSVVITHHLPFYELTHPKYKNSFYANYQQWFHANLDKLIMEHEGSIAAWIYGHTHSESVQNHYNTRFYCNPLGYSGENEITNVNKVCDVEIP